MSCWGAKKPKQNLTKAHIFTLWECAYRARKRQEFARGTFPQARVVLIYRQWKQWYTDRTDGARLRRTKARRIRLCAVCAPNRQEPDGKKYMTCILALTVFCSALFGVCSRCANMFITPDSTDRCTEFVVKVQINSSHRSNMGEASVEECSDSHLLSGIESSWLIQDMKMPKNKTNPKNLKKQQNNQSSLCLLPKTKKHEMI